MRRILIIAGFLVVVGGLVFASLRSARSRGVEVDVENAARRELTAKVSGSGRVEASKSVDVVANVVGKVLEVAVREGDTVQKGQLILRIDPAEPQAVLEQAEASRSSAEANERLARAELKQAEHELTRIKDLVASGLASERDLEGAETTRDVRQARLSAAQHNVADARARVEQARTALDRTVVRADIAGVVVRLAVEEGENVLAGDLYNRGSAIVTVANLGAMEAHVLVDETEVVHVEAGQSAEVEVDAFPDAKIAGTVIEVGNSAYDAGPLGSQEAKDFRIRILLTDPPPALRPGLTARAEIVTDTRADALSVPIESLVLRDPEDQARKLSRKGKTRRSAAKDEAAAKAGETKEKEGVFVEREGVAAFVPLTTGIAGERHFEVLAGLEEGAPVIRGPFDALRRLDSGERVRVRDEKSRAKAAKAEAEEGAGAEAAGGDAGDGS